VSDVRAFRREDLDSVLELYERVMRSGSGPPPGWLGAYFERTFLTHPWADPELPCRVYESGDGRILAFAGAHVRRIRFDGQPGRLVCVGQLVSDPAARRRGAGAVLLRDLLSGPQELTITDGATPEVARIWEPLGGRTVFPRSIAWTRLFRPARAIGDRLLERRGWSSRRGLARPLFSALDAAGRRATRPPPPEDADPATELSAEAFLRQLPEVLGDARLHLDYDEAFLGWLFSEMAAVRERGELVRRCVTRNGRLAGWYVAYLEPGGVGQVMQVAAAKGALERVLDELFAEAWRAGAAALEGRLETNLFEPLSRRRCVIRPGERVLVHSANPEVQAAVGNGQTFLTRLDGEWWMGHHLPL
jgi:hypothetical protein